MGGGLMHRAISHYIKKRVEKIDSDKNESYINQTFDLIEAEIDKVKRTEINKAKKRKLRGRKINE